MLRFLMESIIWEPYLGHDENSKAKGIKEEKKKHSKGRQERKEVWRFKKFKEEISRRFKTEIYGLLSHVDGMNHLCWYPLVGCN